VYAIDLFCQCCAYMQVKQAIKALCNDIGHQSAAIVEAFGIPEHLLAAPIAADWVEYNKVDNRGELTNEAW
jgi:acyl-CoA oxidase